MNGYDDALLLFALLRQNRRLFLTRWSLILKKKMNDTLICLRFRQKFWNRLFTYLTLAFLGWDILEKMKSNFSSFFTFLRVNVFSIFHFFFHFKLKTSQITFPATRSCSHYESLSLKSLTSRWSHQTTLNKSSLDMLFHVHWTCVWIEFCIRDLSTYTEHQFGIFMTCFAIKYII